MFRNFVIVGTQRTGSTALLSTLNFHPEIACGSEWTQNTVWYRKLQLARRALAGDLTVLSAKDRMRINKQLHDGTRWLGFKVLFRSSDKWLVHPRFGPSLWLDRLEGHVLWFRERSDIHVIHIVRRDAVEWLKSKYLSSTTGLFAVTPYPDGTKIEIPIRRALRRLKSKDWVDSRLARLADTNPYVRVAYEDFLADRENLVRELMRFLDCDPARFEQYDYRGQKKQSKGSARDYISNFERLTERLQSYSQGR